MRRSNSCIACMHMVLATCIYMHVYIWYMIMHMKYAHTNNNQYQHYSKGVAALRTCTYTAAGLCANKASYRSSYIYRVQFSIRIRTACILHIYICISVHGITTDLEAFKSIYAYNARVNVRTYTLIRIHDRYSACTHVRYCNW